MSMKKIILSSLLCLCFHASAWTERGNGGNTLICADHTQDKFYDTYEAESIYGLKPVFPLTDRFCSDHKSCLKLSLSVAQSLIARIPEAGHRLKVFMYYRLSNFEAEANFLDNVILLPVNDIGVTVIPRNCTLYQTVIQREPRFRGDKRYIISNDKWKMLTAHHQAVGIIHELLYSYALHIKRQGVNSELIRYFNALIISGEISSYTNNEYYDLHRLVFKTFAVNNE